MKTIEIFKTNVIVAQEARILIKRLKELMPGSRVNFDLADPENILRIETTNTIDLRFVANWMQQAGYAAEAL